MNTTRDTRSAEAVAYLVEHDDGFQNLLLAGTVDDRFRQALEAAGRKVIPLGPMMLSFDAFRAANVARCLRWHPEGIESWSPSDWLTAVTGELGELASLLKMRNRERDGLAGNKFSPTDKMIADELADVLTYLDLLAAVLGVNLGRAAVEKFNEVSERVGFPDRIGVELKCDLTPELIPEGIYYKLDSDNFYNRVSREGMGAAFYEKWKPRRGEFPTRPEIFDEAAP